MTEIIIGGVLCAGSLALAGVFIYLNYLKDRDNRLHDYRVQDQLLKHQKDLMDRLMARDYYDYKNSIAMLKSVDKETVQRQLPLGQMLPDDLQKIIDERERNKTEVPAFISQERP